MDNKILMFPRSDIKKNKLLNNTKLKQKLHNVEEARYT